MSSGILSPWVILSSGTRYRSHGILSPLLFRLVLFVYAKFSVLSQVTVFFFQQARKSLFCDCSMEDHNFPLREVKYTQFTQVHIEMLLTGQV